jgi:hypothetical protein
MNARLAISAALPTDKSIPPAEITKVIPNEIMAANVNSFKIRLTRLFQVRKPGAATPNAANTRRKPTSKLFRSIHRMTRLPEGSGADVIAEAIDQIHFNKRLVEKMSYRQPPGGSAHPGHRLPNSSTRWLVGIR